MPGADTLTGFLYLGSSLSIHLTCVRENNTLCANKYSNNNPAVMEGHDAVVQYSCNDPYTT